MPDLEDIRLASNDVILPGTGGNNKEDLTLALKDNGFDKSQKFPVENFNFIMNAIYDWIVELDSRTITGITGAYPVGSLYTNVSDITNPATLLGFGTWERFGQGRVLISEGTGTDDNALQQTFNIGQEGGEYAHTSTVDEMPSHTHTINGNDGGSNAPQAVQPFMRADGKEGNLGVTESTGGNQAHNNVQPYITVFMWVRTA